MAKGQDTLWFLVKLLSSLGTFVYYMCDHVLYFLKVQLLTSPSLLAREESLQRVSCTMWLTILSCELIANLRELYIMKINRQL